MAKHFFTTVGREATSAIRNGRALESVACYVLPVTGIPERPVVAVFRAYNPSNDDHLFTSDAGELQNAINQVGYQAEGIGWLAYDPNQAPAGTVALRRFVSSASGEHFYTADPNEANNITQALGFQEEPAPCFVYDLNQTSAPAGTIPLYRLV